MGVLEVLRELVKPHCERSHCLPVGIYYQLLQGCLFPIAIGRSNHFHFHPKWFTGITECFSLVRRILSAHLLQCTIIFSFEAFDKDSLQCPTRIYYHRGKKPIMK